MKIYIYISIVLFIVSCEMNVNSNTQNKETVNTFKNDTLDTTLTVEPFLKNTIYIAKRNTQSEYEGFHPILIDKNYTPSLKYNLNSIMVDLNLNKNTAYVTTNIRIKHLIKSIIYERHTKYYKDKNGKIQFVYDYRDIEEARITTNRGVIKISPTERFSYNLDIEYDNFEANSYGFCIGCN